MIKSNNLMLCSIENTTLGLQDFKVNDVIEIAENEVKGWAGCCVDRMLIKKSLRRCKLLGVEKFGEQTANGTYTGALDLLKQNKLDIHLNPEFPLYIKDIDGFLKQSIPVINEKYLSIQELFDPDQHIFNLLNNFNFSFELNTLFFAVLFFSFIFYLLVFHYEIGKKLTILSIFKSILPIIKNKKLKKKHYALGIFFIFLNFYFFFLRLMVTNNIKTSRVIINFDHLIKNDDDILNTNKLHCFAKELSFADICRTSPPNSLLRKVYDLKSNLNNGKCIIDFAAFHRKVDLKNTFALVAQKEAYLFCAYMSTIFKEKSVFSSETSYQLVKVLYYIVRKKEYKNLFNIVTLAYTENGLFEELLSCTRRKSKMISLNNGDFITSVQDVIEKKGYKMNDLAFENFHSIFQFYFLFNLIILLIYFINLIYMNMRRLYKRF